MKTYVVKPGDTLTGICLKQGLCKLGAGKAKWNDCLEAARKVAAWNKIADFNKIEPGQVLLLLDEPMAADDFTPAALVVAKKVPWYRHPATWMMAIGAGLVWFNRKGRK